MPRPREYNSQSQRQTAYLLRKRMRAISESGSSYLHVILRMCYAQIGHDVETEINLPWMSADLVYQAAHRFGETTFREFVNYASETSYVEMNRLATGKPKIRLGRSNYQEKNGHHRAI